MWIDSIPADILNVEERKLDFAINGAPVDTRMRVMDSVSRHVINNNYTITALSNKSYRTHHCC